VPDFVAEEVSLYPCRMQHGETRNPMRDPMPR